VKPQSRENGAGALEELRRYKVLFDNAWTLVTVLATALAVLCWYFRLAEVDIGAILWCLAALALSQFSLNARAHRIGSAAGLRRVALGSQLLGTALLGTAWHLLGGLQQPVFPLFMMLPLVPGALLLGFWQRLASAVGLLAVLASGVLLSPDTNSFIQERYGFGIDRAGVLPDWLPRSPVAFADVNTSPSYNLLVVVSVAAVGVSLITAAGALVSLCGRMAGRVPSLESEVTRLQQLATELVTRAPFTAVSVIAGSGRIINVSERFRSTFAVADVPGQFLLDVVAFAYPNVIRRLLQSGGEEIQGATVSGREVVLRMRAEVLGEGGAEIAVLNLESCDEICWRGEVDSLDEPVFVVNSRGRVTFLNRSALSVFGAAAEGIEATALFDTGAVRWWDIAPLDCARRIVQREGRSYLASIRRNRIAPSLGELSFVHLYEREAHHAVAAS
jgi:PAS domain-containing protein